MAVRLNNLAGLLKASNRLSEAEPLMRRALAIDEASYGPDHPTVAIRLNNLAKLLQATNRLAEAEPLSCQAVSIVAKSLGLNHLNSQKLREGYLSILQDLSLSEAEIQDKLDAIDKHGNHLTNDFNPWAEALLG